MTGKFIQNNGVINCVVPVADTFASAANGDVIRADGCEEVVFIVVTGASAATENVITVQACDTVVPGTGTAITFNYVSVTTAGTYGALTAATVSGFSMASATANQYHIIMVDPADVEAANSHAGNRYVRCVVTEDQDVPQVGCVVGLRTGEHQAHDVLQSAIV